METHHAVLVSIVLIYGISVVSSMPMGPGHGHGKPSPPPRPPPRPPKPNPGFEKYKNKTIEENANKGVNFRLIGGDILLSPSQQSLMEATANQNDPYSPLNAVINEDDLLWTDGRIPYILDSSLSNSAQDAINEAMESYETHTCIRFQGHTNEADYVRFFPGDGCYSYIGRIGGEQDISIGRGCEYPGIVMHEIFHLLGRWHEQSRPDRDYYVSIGDDNIQSGFESNFEKVSSSISSTQGVPYDYGSVMHYGAYAFSRNGDPTIEPIRSSGVELDDLGQRDGLSSMDLEHAKVLYCSGDDNFSWGSWGSWSSCSRSCNGGVRRRARTCNGGYSCSGSNIDTEDCNTRQCRVTASWSTWSEWSDCSASCGTGRQERQRRCQNGNTCSGRIKQYRDCNSEECPEASTWGAWGGWSTCSQTCQGGTRFRRRRCLNGNRCEGSGVDTDFCNSDVSCTTITSEIGEWSEWSDCTADCGGGTRFRTRECSDEGCVRMEREDCNTEDCNPEPLLQGIQRVGCYFVPAYSDSIYFLEGETSDLSDNPRSREQPVRKCGSAAQSFGYNFFAVTVGYCVSGSSSLVDYQYVPSQLCEGGVGGYYAGWFLMDVYEIVDNDGFSDSVASIVSAESTTMATTNGGVPILTSVFTLSVTLTATVLVCVRSWIC